MKVEFQNKTYDVPDWTKWLTLDADGDLIAWDKEPYLYEGLYYIDNHDYKQYFIEYIPRTIKVGV